MKLHHFKQHPTQPNSHCYACIFGTTRIYNFREDKPIGFYDDGNEINPIFTSIKTDWKRVKPK